MIGRHLSGTADDLFSNEVAKQADGILAAVGREDRLKSEGWRDGGAARERLTKQDWQSRVLVVGQNQMRELVPWTRRIPHPDRIHDVVVDAHDVRKMLASIPSPPLATVPGDEHMPAPTASKPNSRRAGALPKYDWEAAEEAFLRQVDDHGWPENQTNEDGWRSKADVERWVISLLTSKSRVDEELIAPGRSTAERYVGKWLGKYRSTKAHNS